MATTRRTAREIPAPDRARRAHWGGRHDADLDDFSGELSLRRVRLDSGGYTTGKYPRYYGTGAPLWNVQDDSGGIDFDIRAASRAAAKAEVRRMYPRARFYR